MSQHLKWHNPQTLAIHCGIIKRVECRGCRQTFYEAVESTRKYHTGCVPRLTTKEMKRIHREINN